MSDPLERLRYHVTGAIERGEAVPIVEVPVQDQINGNDKQTFRVTVHRSYETTVEVQASDARAALRMVEDRNFELPSRENWQAMKDWQFSVADANYNDLIDYDGNDVAVD